MATATDERGGELTHSSLRLGRNIFRSSPFGDVSPMEQLKMPEKLTSGISELPSPVDEKRDDIELAAYSLARDYITYKVEGNIAPKPHTDKQRTLRRVGDEMIDRHQTVVHAVATRLRYNELKNDSGYKLNERMFTMIADQMSQDSQENWGRVVSLFVLGAILAINDNEEQQGKNFESIIDIVARYVGNHKRKWIQKNGGWEGFVRFFDNGSSEEKKVWKGLICAGIGLVSIATAVSTRQ